MTTNTKQQHIVKTPSDLKFYHELKNPESPYFRRGTMSFFGDTMRNFSVSKETKWSWHDEQWVECYVLYRKTTTHKGAPCGLLAHFDVNTFETLHCISDGPKEAK